MYSTVKKVSTAGGITSISVQVPAKEQIFFF